LELGQVTRLKTPMYKVLAEKYIQLYIRTRNEGYHGEQARLITKIHFQDFIISYMQDNPADASVIITAYENIKCDGSLQEKANIKYDLDKCSDMIKSKYMSYCNVMN
jgi:hypothetical protein